MAVSQEMNLMDMISRFNSDEKCREYLEELRWPNGVTCPDCGSTSVSYISTRAQYDCNSIECRRRFSVTAGTLLHDSHLPLSKWFMAVYLMIESKKGISALQLKRTLGVAYKTAWYLSHRIRKAMMDSYPMPLKGRVEIDETWIGGKVKGKGQGYKGNKAVVVGAYQRGGNVVLKVVKSRSKKALDAFIDTHVADDASHIYTDEWTGYSGLSDHNTKHETVNHSEDEYARGEVSTNGIENIWGLFKRQIIGAHHHMSIKHLERYLDEMEWRFNNRDNPYLFRDTCKKLLEADPMEYAKLTA